MATTFNTPINNVRSTLQSSHTSGSGTLAVATGTGTLFGSTFPLRVTVVTAASYGTASEVLTIFSVTARATDSLTVTAIEGTSDAPYAAGAFVEMRDTAGSFSDIHTAVNALENNISGVTTHAVMLGEGTTATGSATIGTAGRVLTDQGAGADPIFTALPTATVVNSILTTNYSLTASFANSGLSVTLPSAGTYLIWGSIRAVMVASSTVVGDINWVELELYDVTNSAKVPNSQIMAIIATSQAAGLNINSQTTAAIGPYVYPVSASAVVQLWAQYVVGSHSTIVVSYVGGDSGGNSVLTALRVY